MLLNILLIIVVIVQIIFLSVTLSKYPVKKELFSQGYGTTFGEFVEPMPPCRDENDCSRGHPARWTYYENMCQPITFDSAHRFLEPGLGLLKEKRDLRDLCLKRL
tara:strand:+ start:433 stop:747 length:315 start_codon:yes stop_codon:yes gene_type:complete